MNFMPIDTDAAEPPYEQLRVQIASQAAAGTLPAGTRLPTVRTLASELHLAVNTVAKAYRALEADGVVVTEGRRGTFVSSGAAASTDEAAAAAERYAATARSLGLGLAEAQNLLDRAW